MSDEERTVSTHEELVELARANTQGELSTTAHAVARARFIDAVTRRHRRASGSVIVGALGLSIGAAALVGALVVQADPPSPSIASEPKREAAPAAFAEPPVAEAAHAESIASAPPRLLAPGVEPASPRRAPDALGDPWARHRDAGARAPLDIEPWAERTTPSLPAPQDSAPSRPPSLHALMSRYVRAERRSLMDCWDRQVQTTPKPSRRVGMRLAFHVERGRLVDVTASGSELPKLEECITSALESGSPALPEDAEGDVSTVIHFH